MKTRNGFVSNSSSSSFAITRKPEDTVIKISFDFDIAKNSNLVIKNEQELLDVINGRDYEFSNENIKKMKAALKRGEYIYLGRYSDDNEINGFLVPRELISSVLPKEKGVIYVYE